MAPEDVHAEDLDALKTERASLDQRSETPASKARKAALEKAIAAHRSKRGKDKAETTEAGGADETAVPPGPISKRKQAKR